MAIASPQTSSVPAEQNPGHHMWDGPAAAAADRSAAAAAGAAVLVAAAAAVAVEDAAADVVPIFASRKTSLR